MPAELAPEIRPPLAGEAVPLESTPLPWPGAKASVWRPRSPATRRCGAWSSVPLHCRGGAAAGGRGAAGRLLQDPSIGQCASTRSSKDGCFQAHLLAVVAGPPLSHLDQRFRTLADGLGCFPLVSGPSHPETDSRRKGGWVAEGGPSAGGAPSRSVFGVSMRLVWEDSHPHPLSALPPTVRLRGFTSIDFAENQLSPSLMSLSPLPTSHPRLLLQTWVQPSVARSGKRQLAHG